VDKAGRAQKVGALDDDHVCGADGFAAGLPTMMDEGVDRGGDVAPGLELGKIAHHQFVVARRDVVEIEGRGVEPGQTGGVAIIGILAHQYGCALWQGADKRFGKGALAGARASGDGDENWHAGLSGRNRADEGSPKGDPG
jgi:hypothetical protein